MKAVQLFDFVESIGAHIAFSGSFEHGQKYINVYIQKNHSHAAISKGRGASSSLFGRSNGDMDTAMMALVKEASNTDIVFDEVVYSVPTLIHARGYRR